MLPTPHGQGNLPRATTELAAGSLPLRDLIPSRSLKVGLDFFFLILLQCGELLVSGALGAQRSAEQLPDGPCCSENLGQGRGVISGDRHGFVSGAGQEAQCWVCREEPRIHHQKQAGMAGLGAQPPSIPHSTGTGHEGPHPTLTHALIPLVVLHVALRTAAAVASEHVLATMLAPVVSITLVHICSNVTQMVVRQLLPGLRAAQGPCVHGTCLGASILEGVQEGGRFF